MKNKTDIYHVFTNGYDEYFTDEKAARACFFSFSEDYGTARLYIKYKGEDEDKDGDCLESYGDFPY